MLKHGIAAILFTWLFSLILDITDIEELILIQVFFSVSILVEIREKLFLSEQL